MTRDGVKDAPYKLADIGVPKRTPQPNIVAMLGWFVAEVLQNFVVMHLKNEL